MIGIKEELNILLSNTTNLFLRDIENIDDIKVSFSDPDKSELFGVTFTINNVYRYSLSKHMTKDEIVEFEGYIKKYFDSTSEKIKEYD